MHLSDLAEAVDLDLARPRLQTRLQPLAPHILARPSIFVPCAVEAVVVAQGLFDGGLGFASDARVDIYVQRISQVWKYPVMRPLVPGQKLVTILSNPYLFLGELLGDVAGRLDAGGAAADY